MKIKHKVHKKVKFFPFELVWMTSIPQQTFSPLAFRDVVNVHDEEELWDFKELIESGPYFLYWITDWTEVKMSLEEIEDES